MKDRFLNFIIPFGGGSIGATGSVISNVTWAGLGEMALQAAVFAIIGGLLGWGVKYTMDRLVDKKKK